MASEAHKLHIFFFPFMAYGHMIPTVDIARLVAARGAKATIITTFLNAEVLIEIAERERNSGLDISILELRFPAKEVGLPEGLDTIDSPEMMPKFFMGVSLLQEPLKKLLEEHRPDVLVADMFLPWATDIARDFGIPRIVFHGTSFFSLCISESLTVHEPYNKIPAEQASFVVPGLPDQIEMTRSQLPDTLTSAASLFTEMLKQIRESELRSYGVIVNSFYELEPAYAAHYRNVMGRKAWHIGPVSLRNSDSVDKAQRGRQTAVNEDRVLSWLDSKNPNSVLYISFGSAARMCSSQLMEIAVGLESSGVSFCWVIRKSTNAQLEEDKFLLDNFEERIQGKGLIIRDWAPQVLILDHRAIGGFMTHCGWNSILEGISAGVPMITWPIFAEQFHNEKLVTQVLKIGTEVGNKKYNEWLEVNDVCVKRERVQEVVSQLMGDGEEAELMRKKARELKDMAKRAVEEDGSSYKDLTDMLEELRMYKQTTTQIK